MISRRVKKGIIATIVTGIICQSIGMAGVSASEPLPAVGAEILKEQYCEKELDRTECTYMQIAEIRADCLNVRKGEGTDTPIIGQLNRGEKKKIEAKPEKGWIPIEYLGERAYISAEYVSVTEEPRYLEFQKEKKRKEITEKGKEVVAYAKQFLGNPYVWGGTSLTEGADCSGFVQSVYRRFKIELPRTTWDMETAGTGVDYDEILPGDLILYDGHVGIYMGEDKIINAIDEENGIGISSAHFTDIITIRRVIE